MDGSIPRGSKRLWQFRVYLPINEAGDAMNQSDETVRSGSADEERSIESETAARRGVHRENPVVIF